MRKICFKTKIHYQLPVGELVEQALQRKEGALNDTGALVISTGKFTGRSPDDKFIVKDTLTKDAVNWNKFNNPIEESSFLLLKNEMLNYLDKKTEIWIREAYACADPAYRLNLRIINENPWGNHFAANMFIAPRNEELENFEPEWTIIQAPGFKADPESHGTRQSNFTVVSFTHKTILIGGTGYTGEIKKGVFTVLNYILPLHHKVLSMHCSANESIEGNTLLFFGLSGTGKTTLSSDPFRRLIGDDEHGWDHKGIFNFEGGCYAKVINLSSINEPAIFHALHSGALVENTSFICGTNKIDFESKVITENTRASYPLEYIPNSKKPSVSGIPKNLFFLSCDVYGVLPPVSKLSTEQAMFYFICGYTAKIAGTESGIKEPQATFSTCFGAPFLPLHPTVYAALLEKKLEESNTNVWLINTGWTGGGYGTGSRIKLAYTRTMVNAALYGYLDEVAYQTHPVFGLHVPQSCPGVPSLMLNPADTWGNPGEYQTAAEMLAQKFKENYHQFNLVQL